MIEVDDDVLAPGPGDPAWYTNETFAVSAADSDAAATAMIAAGERFFLVGHDGEIYEDIDAADESDNCPVHYVSPPKVTERGIEMYVDLGGSVIDKVMRASLVQILEEELTRAGVLDAKVVNATPPPPG